MARRPTPLAPAMSVDSRSPTMATLLGSPPRRLTASWKTIGPGLPMSSGSTPVAVVMTASSAPAPGSGPSSLG